MGVIEKVKLDRVICDEIFYISKSKPDTHFRGPVGTSLGSNPRITGTATAAVLGCRLKQVGKGVKAVVRFMVQEELTVTPGGRCAKGMPFALEYAFRFSRKLAFQKCQIPSRVELEKIKCQVFRLDAEPRIDNLRFQAAGNSGAFDNVIEIMLKLKVTEEVQRFVTLGTKPDIITRPILPPDRKKRW